MASNPSEEGKEAATLREQTYNSKLGKHTEVKSELKGVRFRTS
jgi:hypothetical protein